MIIVTGASGLLGRAIVEHLLERLDSEEIGISLRDPDKAEDLARRGVQVRQADYENPQSLKDAWKGARQVLLISSNGAAYGADPLQHHRNAIEAARDAGVGRIVYTSQISASPISLFPPGRDHAATEAMLVQSGLRWTSLRNGFYASSALGILGDLRSKERVDMPENGPIAWATHADLAAGAATVLIEEGRFEGPTPPLTGPEALTFGELVALASKSLNRSIAFNTISDSDLANAMTRGGVPPERIAIAQGLYEASRKGEFGPVNPTLAGLVSRPLQTMKAVIEEAFPA
jgi:NAD(P)H dehydrogenase (quinone)